MVILPFFLVNDNKFASKSRQLRTSSYYLLCREKFEAIFDNKKYSNPYNAPEPSGLELEKSTIDHKEILDSMTSKISMNTQIKQEISSKFSLSKLEIKFGSSVSLNILEELSRNHTERNIIIKGERTKQSFSIPPGKTLELWEDGDKFLLYTKDKNRLVDFWIFKKPGIKPRLVEYK